MPPNTTARMEVDGGDLSTPPTATAAKTSPTSFRKEDTRNLIRESASTGQALGKNNHPPGSTASTMELDESVEDSNTGTLPPSSQPPQHHDLPPPQPPDTLDGTFAVEYSPRHSYGRGVHSWVRPAVHRITGQRYAVKSVRAFQRPEAGLLVHEANMLRKLAASDGEAHPAIVQLHTLYQDTSSFHLVMEACRGGEVFELVQHATEHGKLVDEAAAVRILRQVVDAVAYCHDRHNVVHRDLKLENILFKHRGGGGGLVGFGRGGRHSRDETEIRLIDFGLSVVHSPDDPPLTDHVGSPYYVAPEVLRRSYDRACDIWSLGALTYALLSGEPPFDGETDLAIFQSICQLPLTFTHPAWDTTLSPAARSFVSACLTKDPRARPTAAALLQHEWLDSGPQDPNESDKLSRRDHKWRRLFRRPPAAS